MYHTAGGGKGGGGSGKRVDGSRVEVGDLLLVVVVILNTGVTKPEAKSVIFGFLK